MRSSRVRSPRRWAGLFTGWSLLVTLGLTAAGAAVAPQAVAATPTAAAVSGSTPKVSDTTPRVGQTLTVTSGTWKPVGTALTYQWYHDSRPIAGQTGASYVVRPADRGHRLTVSVVGQASGFTATRKTSSATAKVGYGYFRKATVAVSDTTPVVDQVLTAVVGTWTPTPTTTSYQWYKVSSKGKTSRISGATHATYTVASAVKGYRLKVKVSVKSAGYHSTSVTSPKTSRVAPKPTSVTGTPPGPAGDLRVGTWNLSGSNTDKGASGDHEAWSRRMPKVVSEILGEGSDVVGLQEAYWGGTTTQYAQLVDALNRAGGSYAVADSDKSTSAGTRIIYNTTTLKLLDHGAYKYARQTSGKTARYLAWATFRESSGKEFFFANTHLDPYSGTVKVAEWRELIKEIPRLNSGGLPVVTVGDFNTSKWWSETKETLPAMKAAGFGDVMNQQYQTNPPTGVRAETVVNGWINSFNGYRRDVSKYSYPTRHDKVGNGVDWIFATNSLRVKQWKVVIDFDPNALKINGVIPSDHNMLSAIIVL